MAELRQTREVTADGHFGEPRSKPTTRQAITPGEQKYTKIPVPVLAIFADPQDYGPSVSNDPAIRKAVDAVDIPWKEARVKAFEAGVPSARVVRLPQANHYIFISNETDVLREMQMFLAGLDSPRVDLQLL